MVQAARITGTKLATTGLIGPGIGIGVVFGALILGVVRNPSLREELFSYAILGFTLAEVTGFFALMMAFILLYVTPASNGKPTSNGKPAFGGTIVLQSGFNLWILTATSIIINFNKLLDELKITFVYLSNISSECNNLYQRIYPVEVVCPSNDEFFTGFFSLLYNPYITLFLLFLCMLIFIFLIYSIINNKISNILIVLLVLSMLFIVYFNIGCSLALCNEFYFYKVNNMWKLVFVIYLFYIFIIICFALMTPLLLLFLITKYFVIRINNKIKRKKVIMLPVKLQQVVLNKNIPISSHNNIRKNKKIKKAKKIRKGKKRRNS